MVFVSVYSSFNRMVKANMETKIRSRILWRLFWVCTVWLCPIERCCQCPSSFAILSLRKLGLVALLYLCSCYNILCIFLMAPLVDLSIVCELGISWPYSLAFCRIYQFIYENQIDRKERSTLTFAYHINNCSYWSRIIPEIIMTRKTYCFMP